MSKENAPSKPGTDCRNCHHPGVAHVTGACEDVCAVGHCECSHYAVTECGRCGHNPHQHKEKVYNSYTRAYTSPCTVGICACQNYVFTMEDNELDPVLKEVEKALVGRTIQNFDLIGAEDITKEFKIMLDSGTIITISARKDPAFGAVIDIDYFIAAVTRQNNHAPGENQPITAGVGGNTNVDTDFGPQTHPSWRIAGAALSEDQELWEAANIAWPKSNFVQSVGENLEKYGRLTPKQREALQNIVLGKRKR